MGDAQSYWSWDEAEKKGIWKPGLPKSGVPGFREAFLQALKDTGTIGAACGLCGVSRASILNWKQRDDEFRDQVEEIYESETDKLEKFAMKIAVSGYEEWREAVTSGGEIVKLKQMKFAPNHLAFMLSARRPETYRTKAQVEHSGEVTMKRIVFTSERPEENSREDSE